MVNIPLLFRSKKNAPCMASFAFDARRWVNPCDAAAANQR
jgi:hypothetical protein